MEIVTRIAPSPTGTLHVGTARSALFNYLYAKSKGGKFIIRIEDTDKERSEPEFEQDILEGLHALGLKQDELYKQSERYDIYEKYIRKLVDSEKAYLSKEASKADESKEVEVVRLKNPGKEITFSDEVRGEITFDTTELGDFVIARSVTEPLYHLAVVIDDETMGVTHVIRGEDHISNTPRQILIQEAFGFDRPVYAHMPLILGPDKSKLSKRHGAASVNEYLKDYTPSGLVNYLALLGWNPGTEEEFFTLEQLVEEFDLSKVQKGGAIFSTEKLDSINQHYLKEMSEDIFIANIKSLVPESIQSAEQFDDRRLFAIAKALKERVKNMKDVRDTLGSGSLDFYVKTPTVNKKMLIWKDSDKKETKEFLSTIQTTLELIDATSFDSNTVKEAVWDYATEKGRGSVLWPLRYCLSGEQKSPDPFTISSALGKEETLKRINKAIEML